MPTCSGTNKAGKPCGWVVPAEGAFCHHHFSQLKEEPLTPAEVKSRKRRIRVCKSTGVAVWVLLNGMGLLSLWALSSVAFWHDSVTIEQSVLVLFMVVVMSPTYIAGAHSLLQIVLYDFRFATMSEQTAAFKSAMTECWRPIPAAARRVEWRTRMRFCEPTPAQEARVLRGRSGSDGEVHLDDGEPVVKVKGGHWGLREGCWATTPSGH